ncbi:phospholipase A and acyltransferase 3-like isoform X2 [Esox lucius]|uniref:phospholipase A and acyltransferase 3-like isoform X2 n=1 Tax=Esox lucius TaxID=8010 RepID=UPI0014772F81|nr:phospholipase A and acyltransferase 3-like isoform X2 [Esox lucius]
MLCFCHNRIRKSIVQIMPQPGDLIEIFRGTYQHWALYVGEGYIVHLCPPKAAGAGAYSLVSVLCDTAVVTKERLEEIVGKDRFLVNNLLDGEHQPRNIYDILRDARSLLGLEMPYCIMRGNCEHFVTELRYGRAESRQVYYALGLGVRAVGVGMKALNAASSLSCVKSKQKRQRFSICLG